MLPFCRNITCHLRFGNISKAWNVSSVVSKYVNTEYDARRKYSGMSRLPSGLELKRYHNSPLYMANSKRNIEYNLFFQLVEIARSQFIFVKQFTGFEWWAIIVLCTVPLRVTLTYFVMRKAAQLAYEGNKVMQITEGHVQKELKATLDHRMSPFQRRKLLLIKKQRIYLKVCREENYNPWLLIIYSCAPFPFWIANSIALRKLAGVPLPFYAPKSEPDACPEMATEGLFWFTNLLEADPYHILPTICGISFFMSTEFSLLTNRRYGEKVMASKMMKFFAFAVKAWSLFFIYAAWNSASIMTYYWFISGISVMCSKLIFLHPNIQKHMHPEHMHLRINPNPYKTIATNMNKRYNPKNWFI